MQTLNEFEYWNAVSNEDLMAGLYESVDTLVVSTGDMGGELLERIATMVDASKKLTYEEFVSNSLCMGSLRHISSYVVTFASSAVLFEGYRRAHMTEATSHVPIEIVGDGQELQIVAQCTSLLEAELIEYPDNELNIIYNTYIEAPRSADEGARQLVYENPSAMVLSGCLVATVRAFHSNPQMVEALVKSTR